MPRRPRNSTGGIVYHVLNRGIAKLGLFETDRDYRAFLAIIAETQERIPCRLLAFCLMPNHWHLLLWPRHDGELSEYLRMVSVTHTQRWHAYHGTAGYGPIYQGRYKAFPVKTDRHFYIIARYVERNALRANLVDRAEQWKWTSISQCPGGSMGVVPIAEWPVKKPEDWVEIVNVPQSTNELESIHRSVNKGCPFGDREWQVSIAEQLGSQSSLRDPGRPSKTGGW